MRTRGFWTGKRVLLTGHTGFKGAWLSLWLADAGASVTGLALEPPSEPSLHDMLGLAELVDDVRADVRDLAAVSEVVSRSQPEIVIHMAAQSLVRPAYSAPAETYAVNVMGTVNVLEAVRQVGGARAVVVVTSDKCYENREWEWAYREPEPMGGHDPYSSSKGCAELVAAAYRSSFFAGSPTRLATARAGNVIGGGDWARDRLVPDAMRAALAGDVLRVRNPHAVRPWQHVLNPLSGYLVLAEALWASDEHATAFNFGPEEADARPVGWIADRLAERWGEGLAWEQDGGEHPHEARFLKVDSSRARERLGWAPAWNLATALDSIVAWTRAYGEQQDVRELTRAQIRAFEADAGVLG